MEKRYTKKQIQEAISFWKRRLNENWTRPTRLRLDAQFDNGFGADELYEPDTIFDLGVDPKNCAVLAVFDNDKTAFPVFDIEVRQHPNFDGDVIVLNLEEQNPADYDAVSYSEFYEAVKKIAADQNPAILVDDGEGNLLPSYAIRVSSADGKMSDQFHVVVRRRDRL